MYLLIAVTALWLVWLCDIL